MMKKEIPKEIPAEFIALFGEPLKLADAPNKPRRSAYEILQGDNAKHKGGAE